jgi:integrase/recombinase XerD
MRDTAYLYDALGRRLYLTPKEGEAFLRTALGHDRPVRTFCSVLYYTGCRLSEALHLTPRRVDFADQVLIVESLKKRRKGVYRAVPVPPVLLDTLDMVHGLKGFDHGVGHPLLLLYDAKAPIGKNSNYFNGLGNDLSNPSISLF